MMDAKRLLRGLFVGGLIGASLLAAGATAEAVGGVSSPAWDKGVPHQGYYHFEDTRLKNGEMNDLLFWGTDDKGSHGTCIQITNAPSKGYPIGPIGGDPSFAQSKALPQMWEFQGHNNANPCNQNFEKALTRLNGAGHPVAVAGGWLVDFKNEAVSP